MPAEPLRMDLSKIAPDAYRHFLQLEGLIMQHVDRKLLHLLKLRASQINGCAYCIAMHTDEALHDGEPVERLTLLDAWEESTLYSEKERAAFAWIEEVTLIADSGASKPASPSRYSSRWPAVPGICTALTQGSKSPAEAIAACMFETVGEA